MAVASNFVKSSQQEQERCILFRLLFILHPLCLAASLIANRNSRRSQIPQLTSIISFSGPKLVNARLGAQLGTASAPRAVESEWLVTVGFDWSIVPRSCWIPGPNCSLSKPNLMQATYKDTAKRKGQCTAEKKKHRRSSGRPPPTAQKLHSTRRTRLGTTLGACLRAWRGRRLQRTRIDVYCLR